MGGGDGFGILSLLPGEHGPQVPYLHDHFGIPSHACEGQGAVEVLAGVVELAGIDQRPCGRRSEVGGDGEQTLPYTLGRGLLLEAEGFGGSGEGGSFEGGVSAAFGVQCNEVFDVVTQAYYVGCADARGVGGGRDQGHGDGDGAAGGRAAEAAAVHGVLQRWCWGGLAVPPRHEPESRGRVAGDGLKGSALTLVWPPVLSGQPPEYGPLSGAARLAGEFPDGLVYGVRQLPY
ncbi:hypothetical protein ACQEV2_42330 [Streptomyces sp. CA-251387]|uniref:hypothetical protein n=1 Tax=Streptomyces sp. CA-251387 TaxID=3240064 RepID=UPI003D8E3B42